jgi:hypothetical protein
VVETPLCEQVMDGGILSAKRIGRARGKNPTVVLLGKGSSTHTVGSSPLSPSK